VGGVLCAEGCWQGALQGAGRVLQLGAVGYRRVQSGDDHP
jgi:hypothetical protein